MKTKIPEALWQVALKGKLTSFGIEENDFQYRKFAEVDLGRLSEERLESLLLRVEPHVKLRGVGMLVKDIKTWLRVVQGDTGAKPRSVEQFASMLNAFLAPVPGHRVYCKDNDREAWFAYYVNEIKYWPEEKRRDGSTPAHVYLHWVWIEFGVRRGGTITFWAEDCLGLKVEEALLRKSIFVETDDLRAQYLEETKRFWDLVGQVGLQVWGTGIGTDNLDGNDKASSRHWGHSNFRLDHYGDPTRMVIDVYKETDKEDRESRELYLNLYFWKRKFVTKNDEEYDESGLPIEDVEERPEIEIPIHPMLACFDMRRHMRLRVHVSCVTEYVYDTELGKGLILPQDVRDLVEMLVTTKGVFKDLIKGKGGGAVVLCAGPPGVGKTLTAEVYAETMKRPLYSIQCSQLGTTPEELEGELMKVFMRSQRWNAILLLDEADVYISARGSDLQQNAIVGVFLRVLEYYAGVLFLTTNRSDLVDDAIASRCVARIDYTLPTKQDQHKIWHVLSKTSGIEISDKVVTQVVEKYSLSGRDVKNLLKLAKMVSDARGKPIDLEMVEFVKRFKPTTDVVS